MKPIGSSKVDIAALLEPTRKNPMTGEIEKVPATERIDAILSHPQAQALVAVLDPQFVYGLIQEAGRNDALDLIAIASPEQLQNFVDFDTWTRDEIELVEFTEWMSLFLQCDDAEFAQLYRTLDQELFVLWFREAVAVYEWEADLELLDLIEDPVYTSPCGQFAMVIPQENAFGPEIRLFIERLYQMDVEEALTLMSEARWALSIELQEELYQLRNGRLSEAGYVPYDEAMAIFAKLDPIGWTQKQREWLRAAPPVEGALPAGQLTPLEPQALAVQEALNHADRPFFATTLATLTPALGADVASEVLSSTMTQMRAVAQRVLVAEGGKPGDPDAINIASERTIDTLSLALEFLSEGDITLSAQALAQIPLRDLHRLGHSVTTQLQQQLRAIAQRGNLTLTEQPFSLLEDQDATLCEGLLQRRPVMEASTQRRFRSVRDIQYVAKRLGQIAFSELFFFAWLGFDRDALIGVIENENLNSTPIELVRFRTLFATFVLNRILDAERPLMPMTLDEFDAARAKILEADDPIRMLTDRAQELVQARQPQQQALVGFVVDYIAETVTWMNDEMLVHTAPTAHNIAQNWVLLRPKGAGPLNIDAPFGKATVH